MVDIADMELRGILVDIHSELRNIRMNWSAPATHIWFVEMPDLFYETQLVEGGGRFIRASDIVTIWGIPFGERKPTPDVPQGIWIEDRDGIFHRVR